MKLFLTQDLTVTQTEPKSALVKYLVNTEGFASALEWQRPWCCFSLLEYFFVVVGSVPVRPRALISRNVYNF